MMLFLANDKGVKMKKRVFNLISLIINLSVIFFNVSAILYNFRSDILRDPNAIWAEFIGWKSLLFFTNLSNIFLLVACSIMLVYNIKNVINDKYEFPKWAYTVKYVACCATTLTMVTVVVFLSPLMVYIGRSYFDLYKHNSLFLHLISPLLGLISVIFLERSKNFKFKNTFLGLIPTALYSIFYIIMVVIIGEANGGMPDFYGFTFGGNNWMVLVSGPAILLATYLFSYLIWFSQKKFAKKVPLDCELAEDDKATQIIIEQVIENEHVDDKSERNKAITKKHKKYKKK